MLHDANSFLILALVHEELWALAEIEQEKPQAKHKEGDAAQRKKEIAPAHIVVAPAALLAWCEPGGVARRESTCLGKVGAAGHGRDEAKGDGGAEDHADGLEDGQSREEEALILREELERDGCVDGNVAAYTEADKGCEDEEGGVIV